MPKMKTDKGAATHVKITGTGRLRRRHANRAHILEKKASKRTRRLGREADFSPSDVRQIRKLLGR